MTKLSWTPTTVVPQSDLSLLTEQLQRALEADAEADEGEARAADGKSERNQSETDDEDDEDDDDRSILNGDGRPLTHCCGGLISVCIMRACAYSDCWACGCSRVRTRIHNRPAHRFQRRRTHCRCCATRRSACCKR